MALFRRSTTTEPEPAPAPEVRDPSGRKSGPTPSRKEAEALRRQGRRMRELAGPRFVRYGECARDSVECAADAQAVGLILKRSFNIGCHHRTP